MYRLYASPWYEALRGMKPFELEEVGRPDEAMKRTFLANSDLTPALLVARLCLVTRFFRGSAPSSAG